AEHGDQQGHQVARHPRLLRLARLPGGRDHACRVPGHGGSRSEEVDADREELRRQGRLMGAGTIERLGAVVRAGQRQPLSAAVAWDRLVFVSGQVPVVAGQPAAPDIAGQTYATLDTIAAILADAGCTLDDVVKTTVWLTDGADYPAFN